MTDVSHSGNKSSQPSGSTSSTAGAAGSGVSAPANVASSGAVGGSSGYGGANSPAHTSASKTEGYGTQPLAEGMYDAPKGVAVISAAREHVSELADDAAEVAAHYYREGSQALSRAPKGIAAVLIVGAIGLIIGPMLYREFGRKTSRPRQRQIPDYESRFRSAESESRDQRNYILWRTNESAESFDRS